MTRLRRFSAFLLPLFGAFALSACGINSVPTKEEAANAPKERITVSYEIGDEVKVKSGPFNSFNGIVEELDFDKNKVKVSVSIFGRATPVELDFGEVDLIS